MKRISDKRRALLQEVNPVRDDYRALFPFCQWCVESMATQLHEISRGAARGASLGIRAALLHLCAECHRIMDWLPVAGQLALKRITDPDGYCRITVNRLRGRADEAITDVDVEKWIRRFDIGQFANRHTGRGADAEGMKLPLAGECHDDKSGMGRDVPSASEHASGRGGRRPTVTDSR